MNERPAPETKPRVDSLVDVLPFSDRIPRHDGEMAFDQAWEIRAFAMTVALHEELGFPWEEFQSELIAAIQRWEAAQTDLAGWSYYERWLAALGELAQGKGWLTGAELDSRTQEILDQPPTTDHHHAVREPVAVVPGA
ncbi:nitrile hydratase accessory protein [Actinomycetospora succinea]|uniref:Nitrile hydratase accessory protein n=1 Tax=Actinomycetospora succinea TaxID=663603 RepID=A0A4R6VA70_9PSEU|nr:nitrile hydratase accessory protein [Actinomycetospora succinea]TDQ58736.1 nitrile hydratase accessory protein [Actinomycetospora succinea]